MPIYEYFCRDCNVIFNFMSVKIAPAAAPICPRCDSQSMKKYLSSFSTSSAESAGELEVTEKRVESAFNNLLNRAEKLTDSDADEVSGLMHSFTKECGVEYTEKMTKVIGDISQGDEQIINKEDADYLLESSSNDEMLGKLTKEADPEVDPRIYQL